MNARAWASHYFPDSPLIQQLAFEAELELDAYELGLPWLAVRPDPVVWPRREGA